MSSLLKLLCTKHPDQITNIIQYMSCFLSGICRLLWFPPLSANTSKICLSAMTTSLRNINWLHTASVGSEKFPISVRRKSHHLSRRKLLIVSLKFLWWNRLYISQSWRTCQGTEKSRRQGTGINRYHAFNVCPWDPYIVKVICTT